MPELPEVETVVRKLKKSIIGKQIKNVIILCPKIVEYPDVKKFKKFLNNEKIISISRRGKYLIFNLEHWDLISHLRMEGNYEYCIEAKNISKHTHLIFIFSDNSELQYCDTRKFGRMVLLEKNTSSSYKGISKLGPEPLSDEFNLFDFIKVLRNSKRAIKPLLLEQRIVAGLGNIYVDEVLWEAKIHPQKRANTLSKKEIIILRLSIIKILSSAVKVGGTMIRSYFNNFNEAGGYQNFLKVYGKNGYPCLRCGAIISKIKVAQRGTHFCPYCQRLIINKLEV
ncbi:DNA-formamidopyrimidine glycosylase [Enterococcus faecalis]|uniref:DNA-formamidopyrimidine glycosylase n=1 Tax=Enterococcus faecalis TaxID=1351 RepID=UPI0040410DEE